MNTTDIKQFSRTIDDKHRYADFQLTMKLQKKVDEEIRKRNPSAEELIEEC